MFVFAPLVAFAALVAAQANPSVNTPASVVQCQSVQIGWTASSKPVFISILPGGQPGSDSLQDLGRQTKSPTIWRANLKAGTTIMFQLRDSAGVISYSAPITVQKSRDSSCLD